MTDTLDRLKAALSDRYTIESELAGRRRDGTPFTVPVEGWQQLAGQARVNFIRRRRSA